MNTLKELGLRNNSQPFEKKHFTPVFLFKCTPSSLSILLYKLNIRCGRGFRVAVEKRGFMERKSACSNKLQKTRSPALSVCLPSRRKQVFSVSPARLAPALSPSLEKREQLYFSAPPPTFELFLQAEVAIMVASAWGRKFNTV